MNKSGGRKTRRYVIVVRAVLLKKYPFKIFDYVLCRVSCFENILLARLTFSRPQYAQVDAQVVLPVHVTACDNQACDCHQPASESQLN